MRLLGLLTFAVFMTAARAETTMSWDMTTIVDMEETTEGPEEPVTGPPERNEPELSIDPSDITADNIEDVVDELADVSPADLEAIPDAAFANADAVSALAEAELSTAQEAAISSKVTAELDAQILAGDVDADYVASSLKFCDADSLASMSTDQITDVLDVFNGNDTEPPSADEKKQMGKAVNSLFSSSDPANAADAAALMETAASFLSEVKPTSFGAVLELITVDDSVLEDLSKASLTSEQGEAFMTNYFDNSATDLSSASDADVAALFESLPAAFVSSVPTSVLADVSASAASDVLSAIAGGDEPEPIVEEATASIGVSASPAALTLYSKIKSSGLSGIDAATAKILIKTGTLGAGDVETVGSTLCFGISDATEYFPMLTDSTARALYSQCSSTFGDLSKTTYDSYTWRLMAVAPAADISGMTLANDADSLALLTLFGEVDAAMSSAQADGLATAVSTLITSDSSVLSDETFLVAAAGALKTLGVSTLEDVSSSLKDELAEELACQSYARMTTSATQDILDWAIKTSIGTRSLFCTGGGDGVGFMWALSDTLLTTYLSDEQIETALDLLSYSVLDDTARATLVGKAQTLYSGSGYSVPELTIIGTLLQGFEDSDLDDITEANLCEGLMDVLLDGWSEQDEVLMYRSANGFSTSQYTVATSASRSSLAIRVLEAEATCATSKRKRRSTRRNRVRRSATTITCDDITDAGQLAYIYGADELDTLTDAEFLDCKSILGRINGFDSDQWETLATKAKSAVGAVSTWASTDIKSLAGICWGLTSSEMADLDLSSVDAISAVGSYGDSSESSKRSAMFSQVLADSLGGDASTMSELELRLLGEITCGATDSNIADFPDDSYCGASAVVGTVTTCGDAQLQAFATHAKECYGTDVSTWSDGEVATVGSVVGGLSADDLGSLSESQIQAIAPQTIEMIPATSFAGFSVEQLGYFSFNQAAKVTDEQFQALSEEQRDVILDTLGDSDDIDLPEVDDDDDDSAGATAQVSLLLLTLSALFAVFRH